ncbi:MAG TPA: homogentisate 1,2-dioxygenase [Oculatellaceae cyanobacterium]
MKVTEKRGESSSKKDNANEKATTELKYQSGFGNQFASEALPGALPEGQNSPQRVPYGLYAEQLSGSSFTSLRHENLRSWLYRIRPSVAHSRFKKIDAHLFKGRPSENSTASPEQMRWDPLPYPKDKIDFVGGLTTIAANGNAASCRGSAVHIYAINKSMEDSFFYDADGEMLIVPEYGSLEFRTELGDLHVHSGEIIVIPRGVRFQVNILQDKARGYVCENFGLPFRLPTLGVIGSNGLANPRDFWAPVAKYEDQAGKFKLLAKFDDHLFESELRHSPLNVVAWHGNYAPYKYDLSRFQTVNSVSFDHSDPSIFTVLTSPSEIPGVANVDFAIFPPRWLVADHTFRPPYYHRNIMSEFMGLIKGVYDAKQDGFIPGGSSLHNCMSAHGPDSTTFSRASEVELKPVYMDNTLAFMFESSLIYKPTEFASSSKILQDNYLSCWQELDSHFSPDKR